MLCNNGELNYDRGFIDIIPMSLTNIIQKQDIVFCESFNAVFNSIKEKHMVSSLLICFGQSNRCKYNASIRKVWQTLAALISVKYEKNFAEKQPIKPKQKFELMSQSQWQHWYYGLNEPGGYRAAC